MKDNNREVELNMKENNREEEPESFCWSWSLPSPYCKCCYDIYTIGMNTILCINPEVIINSLKETSLR